MQRSAWPEHTWKYAAVLAGAVGTTVASGVLLAAYFTSLALSEVLAPPLSDWARALTNNTATQYVSGQLGIAILLHLAMGIVLALFYAGMVDRHLSGPGWWRGMQFAAVPWLLSLAVFLPLLGGGFFGSELGAGPLPTIGNLIVHMVYGATLGWIYQRESVEILESSPESVRANLGAERGTALGITGGALVGGLAGLSFELLVGSSQSQAVPVLAGAALGAGVGAFIGSYLGLDKTPSPSP